MSSKYPELYKEILPQIKKKGDCNIKSDDQFQLLDFGNVFMLNILTLRTVLCFFEWS